MPRPTLVIPATRMGSAYSGGCEEPTKEARVPLSNIGKAGMTTAGLRDRIVRSLPEKKRRHCPTATRNAHAVLIQNNTRRVVINHAPVLGTPYT